MKILPLAEFSYNDNMYSRTNLTLVFLYYGKYPKINFDIEDNALERKVPAARERDR